MKINEVAPEFYFYQHGLSQEVIRAQRLAELEQMAKYRALKLQAYKDWSVPEKRAKIQQEALFELEKAREIYSHMPPEKSKLEFVPLSQRVKITPFVKPIKKRSLWQRLLSMLT